MKQQASKTNYIKTISNSNRYTGKKTLTINDIEIEVTKKDIKNIHLSVHPPNGAVRISVPSKMNNEDIKLFAISKLAWIKKQQSKFENLERIPEREFVSGESYYFLGTKYLLNVIYWNNNKSKIEIRNQEFIDLYVNQDSDKDKRERIMKEWYRKELKSLLPSLIEKWEKKIGVKVESWNIKQMKTRWGTCNTKAKRIWINLELAKKPVYCLEYIIAHELIHLLERSHGCKFILLMDKYYPNWRSIKSELNSMSFI